MIADLNDVDPIQRVDGGGVILCILASVAFTAPGFRLTHPVEGP